MFTIDYWFSYIRDLGTIDEVFQALALELPPLSSLILDRSCRFQCQHCIFQKEISSKNIPDVGAAVLHVLKQLPNVKVVHEGRQFTPRQLPLLEAINRAGYPIGIIESGTYARFIDDILQSDIRFDWMDISIDGPRKIHNLQRSSERSWDTAIEGVKNVRRVLKPKGKVTSLMTITNLNYAYVSETGKEVSDLGIDEWHLTTMSIRDGIEKIRTSEKQLGVALRQMVEVGKSQKIFLRIYNLEDLRSLISIFGKECFSKLLKKAIVTQNALVLDIGFPLFFYPQSLAQEKPWS